MPSSEASLLLPIKLSTTPCIIGGSLSLIKLTTVSIAFAACSSLMPALSVSFLIKSSIVILLRLFTFYYAADINPSLDFSNFCIAYSLSNTKCLSLISCEGNSNIASVSIISQIARKPRPPSLNSIALSTI